jgi:hypothetical protein
LTPGKSLCQRRFIAARDAGGAGRGARCRFSPDARVSAASPGAHARLRAPNVHDDQREE